MIIIKDRTIEVDRKSKLLLKKKFGRKIKKIIDIPKDRKKNA